MAGVLAVVTLLVGLGRIDPLLNGPPRNLNGNPDQFFLWGANSAYQYSFTYDPLAADKWLFESGGSRIGASNPVSLASPYNFQTP